MKICENGVIREMTSEEVEKMRTDLPEIPYEQKVTAKIRERYSLDAELAILRQRDEKPEEFFAYNDYCEACKKSAKTALQ